MDNFVPVIITHDEAMGLWSFYVGDEYGVAETREELAQKIWNIIREQRQY